MQQCGAKQRLSENNHPDIFLLFLNFNYRHSTNIMHGTIKLFSNYINVVAVAIVKIHRFHEKMLAN